jgi:hypothetical protein
MLLKTPIKTLIAVLGITLALCAAPSVADAGLLTGWFGPESAVYRPVYTTAAYQPAAVASGCNTCAPTYAYQPVASGCNTCAPTTAYYPRRTAYRQVAAYAPMTTYVQRYAYRPAYTYQRVYRPMFGGSHCSTCTPHYAAYPMVSSGCCTTGCATGGCATGNCGVPTLTNYGAPVASSGCCGTNTGVSSSTVFTPSPSYSSSGTPTPALASPGPTTYEAPTQAPTGGTPQPDLNVEPEQKTFQKVPTQTQPDTEDPLQPIPQSTGKSSGKGTGIFNQPKIADPQDRTAKVFTPHWEVQQAGHVQPVSKPQRQLSTDGWRAAR